MKYLAVLSLIAVLGAHCSTARRSTDNPWGRVRAPSSGTEGPIGFYDAGCLDGAQGLPIDGRGYQVVRLSRNRRYGTPELLDFITRLGSESMDHGIGVLLIGDMSQPRGGPMPTGHASHQVGLDVDIWFMLDPRAQARPLTAEEREKISSISFVDMNAGTLNENLWSPKQAEMLKLASEIPNVERIFVNPSIKKHLCETLPPEEHGWLHKLRPWYGHNDHFHVRLACPASSTRCRHQEAVAPGDGCSLAELNWWFTPEERAKDKATESPTTTPRVLPELPNRCDAVLNQISIN